MMRQNHTSQEEDTLNREVARELTDEELEMVCGGLGSDNGGSFGGLGNLGQMLNLSQLLGGLGSVSGGGGL